jgi:hypothetical protein
MKDVGVSVDRRTHSNHSINDNLEHRNLNIPPSIGSTIIYPDPRGPGRGAQSLSTQNSSMMTSEAHHDVQELLERLSLEEQVSAIRSIPF